RTSAGFPPSAQLHRQSGDGQSPTSETLPADANDPATYRLLLPRLTESFDYSITAGDARTRIHHVEMIPRPRIERIAIQYTPPAYTRSRPRRVDPADGEISGIPGTTVHLEIAASKPLREAM